MGTVYKLIKEIEENIIGIGLLSAVLLTFANVVLRYVFRSSTAWAEEVIRFIIIWITFIGSAVCFRKASHMGIDLIFTFVKGPFKKYIEMFILITSLLFMIFMFNYGMELVLFTKSTGQVTPALEIRLFWVYIAVPLGCFLSIIEIAYLIFKNIKDMNNSKNN